SRWMLSRILNLTVNVNMYNPLHAGCRRMIELSCGIKMKRAEVINMQSMDNICFISSVVAALHPARSNTDRTYSYSHYMTVLNLINIMFPMMLNQIRKFENLNDISINTYYIEEQKEILSLWLIDRKRGKQLISYVQDPCNDNRTFCMNRGFVSPYALFSYKHKVEDPRNKLKNLTTAQSSCPVRTTSDSYDDSLLKYRFRRDNNCIAWFVEELKHISFMKHVDSIIDKNDQKKICITLHFINSFRFLAFFSSLEKLAYLDKNKLQIMQREFFNLSAENFNLLTSPTDYVLVVVDSTRIHDEHSNRPFCPRRKKPCILNISKTCLYEFHEYMLPLFHEKCKINRFDTNDYAINNAYNMLLINKKVPALMKGENNTCLNNSTQLKYTKIALSPYDDKQYIVPDSIDTLQCTLKYY
ncbi:hypothetical protein ALC53_12175, partial [Atta colombica]